MRRKTDGNMHGVNLLRPLFCTLGRGVKWGRIKSGGCYKSSDEVIKAVTEAGLARVEHHLWPLASIKGGDGGQRRKSRKNSGHY